MVAKQSWCVIVSQIAQLLPTKVAYLVPQSWCVIVSYIAQQGQGDFDTSPFSKGGERGIYK